jgi:hypothetical protein
VAIVRSSNRYGRFGVRKVRDGARRLGHPIIVEMAYRVGNTNFSLQLDRVEEAKPQAIVHWGDVHMIDERGRPRLHQHKLCGKMFDPVMTCSECGEPLSPKAVHVHLGPGAAPSSEPPRHTQRGLNENGAG